MATDDGLFTKDAGMRRYYTVWCKTCPLALADTDEEMAGRHARNNPGHVVVSNLTITFSREVMAAPTIDADVSGGT